MFVLFFEMNDGPALMMIERSLHVTHHKGEIAFPGGIAEPEDASLIATATRETREELGVPAGDIVFWGELDPVRTASGFVVTPFTGMLAGTQSVRPEPLEVAGVFPAAVSVLMDGASEREIAALGEDGLTRAKAYSYNGRIIWGATARIISQALDVLRSVR